MSATLNAMKTIAIAAVAALAITAVGQGVWGALALVNAKVSPAIPWAAAVMLVVLPVLLGVLSGRIGPKAGAAERRALLPLKAVSPKVWAWSLISGAFGLAGVALLWITLGELLPAAPNALPDVSHMPRWTVLAFLVTSIVAAPLTEECAFRGYAMGMIRKVAPDGWALVLVSLMFAAAHLTQGFYLTKLTVYFLVGLGLGFTALRAGSLVPAMVVHSIGDLVFFTLVWPNDAHRQHVTLAAADQAFWLQAAAMVALLTLAVAAYVRLAAVTRMAAKDPRTDLGLAAA